METHARRVIDTYVHEGVETYEVETSPGTVTSTAEHPFYVVGKGWVPVRDLQPGDRLVDPKGSDVDVVAVAATGETATVYNFNVDELHTYHVQTGETWVRVHNICTSVETPYGPAEQELSPAALSARQQVEAGAPIYRVGTMGRSQGAEGQFWALEHPSTPGYAERYGIPQENVSNADFIEQATVPSGTPFVTRSAPPVGDNPGGGIEVVVPPGSADVNWFSTAWPG